MCALLLAAVLAFTPISMEPEPEKIFALFENYFASENISAPKNVSVLGIKIDGGHLILNVSAEILNYGGNANERELIKELLDTAASVEGVTAFTLLVSGELVTLPEGRELDNYKIE